MNFFSFFDYLNREVFTQDASYLPDTYEFGGLLWALEFSYSFANGQIDGYFGTPPSEFWKVFKFYVALYAFEHLSFANGTLEDIEYRISNATRMLTLFGERFELDIPLFRG